jgi:hypothetical protein
LIPAFGKGLDGAEVGDHLGFETLLAQEVLQAFEAGWRHFPAVFGRKDGSLGALPCPAEHPPESRLMIPAHRLKAGCGGSLQPVYPELLGALAEQEFQKIARIDSSQGDVPESRVIQPEA